MLAVTDGRKGSDFNTYSQTFNRRWHVSVVSADQILHLQLHFFRFAVSVLRKAVKISQWIYIRVSTSACDNWTAMSSNGVDRGHVTPAEGNAKGKGCLFEWEGSKVGCNAVLPPPFFNIHACLVFEAVIYVSVFAIGSTCFIRGWDLFYLANRQTV